MKLRIKGSYALALLFSAGLAGWMATGTIIQGGLADDGTTPPPAERMASITKIFKVAAREFVAQNRSADLIIRGRTKAEQSVGIKAETQGQLLKRHVSRGDIVRTGDLLCTLSNGVRRARLAHAQASLTQVEFDLTAKSKLLKSGFASASQVQSLKAQADAARATLAEVNLDIERTEIRAPLGGTVVNPVAEAGDVLKTGDVCATVINYDPMLVIGQVGERDINAVQLGASATIKLVTGQTALGKVTYIARTADAATRTFEIEITIPNSDNKIRDGVTSISTLKLPPAPGHLISAGYLTLADDGRVGVNTVDQGKAKFLPVKILGSSTKGMWVGGLPKKVIIITIGQEYVTDDQPVEVQLEVQPEAQS